MQNNNLSLEDEVTNRDSELSQMRDDQDEIMEEMERLRDDNDRLTHLERRPPPVKRVYEVGVQCESRMCEKACQTRNPHYTPRSRLPRPVASLNATSSMRRACSVGNLSSRAESPMRTHGGSTRDVYGGVTRDVHGGSTRDVSSRIPVGHNRNLHDSPAQVPNRYERYAPHDSGSGYGYRGSHYASSPSGLNHVQPAPSRRRDYMNRSPSGGHHYASSPGLNHNRQVRFRRDSNRSQEDQGPGQGRSLADIRDIEESIQDIGLSLQDIKRISQSIKDTRNFPQPDDQIIEV